MFVIRKQDFDACRTVVWRPGKGLQAVRFRIVGGTCYHHETPFEVVAALELARYREISVCIHYGFTEVSLKTFGWLSSPHMPAGRYRAGAADLTGFVVQSRGPLKRPVIAAFADLDTGVPIYDEEVVAIWPSGPRAGVGPLYKHPGYGPPNVE